MARNDIRTPQNIVLIVLYIAHVLGICANNELFPQLSPITMSYTGPP
jgi:hypothetical protein